MRMRSRRSFTCSVSMLAVCWGQSVPAQSQTDADRATEAYVAYPAALAADAAGNLFILEHPAYRHRNQVFKVDASGRLTVVAGTGEDGFSGDGGPATAATLSSPSALAVDPGGGLYIADEGNGRVRKVDPAGVITTVAGNGVVGFDGDGGPATRASLAYPSAVAVDGAGNVYIADTFNHRVRKVDPLGVMTTVAGNGVEGFAGDGEAAVDASLNNPSGLAVDEAGNLYIADYMNRRIRRVDPGGVITTVAGNGDYASRRGDGGPAVDANLQSPDGVAVDAAGNVLIIDSHQHRLRVVDLSGVITSVAGTGREGFSGDGGPAFRAEVRTPYGVAVDGDGNVYVADTWNHRVRKIDASGVISTVAGDGTEGFRRTPPTVTRVVDPQPSTAPVEEEPASESMDAPVITTFAGGGPHGVPARAASVGAGAWVMRVVSRPDGSLGGTAGPDPNPNIAVDGHGQLFVATHPNRVVRIDASGELTVLAGSGGRGLRRGRGPRRGGGALEARGRGGRRGGRRPHLRYRQPPGSESGRGGRHRHGGRLRHEGFRRRSRRGCGGVSRPTLGRDHGRGRQPLHRGHGEPPYPASRCRRDHHERRGQRGAWVQRRRRAGYGRHDWLRPRDRGGRGRASLLHGLRSSPSAQDRRSGAHRDRGGHRGGGLRRRRRPGDRRRSVVPCGAGPRRQRESVRGGRRQQPRPQDRRHGDHHDRCGKWRRRLQRRRGGRRRARP